MVLNYKFTEEFALSKKGKLGVNNSIWGIEAARILGISKTTFYTRNLKGIYQIRCVRCPKGFRYLIHDVFKIAHPALNDRQVEEFIMDYRIKMTMTKKQSKKEGVIDNICSYPLYRNNFLRSMVTISGALPSYLEILPRFVMIP
jgi:hypothetical protein